MWNIIQAIHLPTSADMRILCGQNKHVTSGKFLQALQSQSVFHECTPDSDQPHSRGQNAEVVTDFAVTRGKRERGVFSTSRPIFCTLAVEFHPG
jgi:hypothetical protein